jgi:hypothetical protein
MIHDISHIGVHKFRAVDRIHYLFDKFIEKPASRQLFLALSLVALIFGNGLAYYYTNPTLYPMNLDMDTNTTIAKTYGDCLWTAWTYMADAGTHSGETTPAARLVAGFIAISGFFFIAIVVGFVVDTVRETMGTLKKGKSMVIEQGHVLILGWTDRCPALLREIALACESEGGGTVVILSELEKGHLEKEMTAHVSRADLRGLRVVIRTGSPMVLKNLVTVAAKYARAVIVLATMHGEADKADAEVLRTVLQLKSVIGTPAKNQHIVAEMRDVDNEKLVRMVGGGFVETVVSHDLVGRLMLMAARQPGLASVYDKLLGFEGEEFYFKEWPELTGVTFGELQSRFPDAIPLGVKPNNPLVSRPGGGKPDTTIWINPGSELVVQDGDELLVLAADDDSYTVKPKLAIKDDGEMPEEEPPSAEPEEILLCGWRRDVDDVIRELDEVLVKGSKLVMLNEVRQMSLQLFAYSPILCLSTQVPLNERNVRLAEGGLNVDELKNVALIHIKGNSSVRRDMAGHLRNRDDAEDAKMVVRNSIGCGVGGVSVGGVVAMAAAAAADAEKKARDKAILQRQRTINPDAPSQDLTIVESGGFNFDSIMVLADEQRETGRHTTLVVLDPLMFSHACFSASLHQICCRPTHTCWPLSCLFAIYSASSASSG